MPGRAHLELGGCAWGALTKQQLECLSDGSDGSASVVLVLGSCVGT